MGYNMYDKNYGSGFTPENDNRPPEERPGYQPPEQTEQAQAAPAAQPAEPVQQAEAAQTAQSGQTTQGDQAAQPVQTAAQQPVVNGEYHYSYGFQPADSTDAGTGSAQSAPNNAYGGSYQGYSSGGGYQADSASGNSYQTGSGYQAGNIYGGTYGASANADYGNGTTPPNNTYYGGGSATPPPKPPRKPKRSGGSGIGRIIAIVLVCVLLGGAAGVGGAYLMFNSLSSSATESDNGDTSAEGISDSTESADSADSSVDIQVSDRDTSTSSSAATSEDGTMSPSQIYEAYSNSVVSIEVQTSDGVGAGTGFVISEDGYILTCYHVVDGYQAISCTFIDSTSYEATYVGGDEDADLAVLKIEATGLTAVVLGDSDDLVVGTTVTAIGNALGTFANTLTTGTVSGLDRALTMEDGTVMNLLQTDCTVNSGNSGGPLFNEYGEVIGIVNAKYSSSGSSTTASIEGIGFAIPINDALDVLDDLINYGYITGKPYLGISVSTVSSITAQQYSNMVVGAYVMSVESGSCSETAGLQVGDIITQVDGVDITTYEELVDAKNNHKAGEEMTLTVYRDGTYYTIVVTLDEEVPDSAADDSTTEDSTTDDYSDGYSYGYGYGYSSPFGGNGGW
ncbi:MAG: trypsin-like peptidase domain-containing protein [Clostridiales bacterium]|nr:trypsin-like peptidase domain-containing protein [Clostridiales bacterium]